MINIRYVQTIDMEFWLSIDKHLSEMEFINKVRDKKGYILLQDDIPIGLLRYNLFLGQYTVLYDALYRLCLPRQRLWKKADGVLGK